MVFLDQRSPSSMLAAWRDAFGRPDWRIAPDRDGAVSTAGRGADAGDPDSAR